MNVLYHHRTAGRGAEGNHIVAFITPVEQTGHEVTIVSPPGVDPRRTAGAVPLDKGATRQCGINRVWQWISTQAPQLVFELAELAYNVQAAVRLCAAVRHRRPAFLYERYAFFLFAGVTVAKVFRIPVLLEVNEIAGIPRARKQVLVRIAIAVEKFVFRRADAIFVVSTYLRDRVLARGALAAAVHVMPNAIDPARFVLNGASGRIRSARGLGDRVVAGFVGWFDDWDRLDLLVDACARVVRKVPNLHLLLVGDGPVAAVLRRRIAEHGIQSHVELTGPVPRKDVPLYIDAMDICVLPDSNPYGSPMVLFEFMALGQAIIAPDLPPIRDVVADGETGVLIRPGNAADLSAALERLLRDPALRARLGASARKQVLRSHTWEANATRILQVGNSFARRGRFHDD
jgi:glycosyltransferase involved in cell wall biosynthesis